VSEREEGGKGEGEYRSVRRVSVVPGAGLGQVEKQKQKAGKRERKKKVSGDG
jgi:hypothetical protein